MGNARQLIPAARTDDLIIREVEGETLVYDSRSNKARCLNPTAALVWKQCDGNQTVSEAAERVALEMETLVSSEVVWLAVEPLRKRGLLAETVKKHGYGSTRMSRREMARRLGVATAPALPFIASIRASAAIQAASCGGIEDFCGGFCLPGC